MIKEPNLKSMAAELDQVIELLEMDAVRKQMLRDAAIKAINQIMSESHAKLLQRVILAFHTIHQMAMSEEGCHAERLLRVAGVAYHNTNELLKLLPQLRQFIPAPDPPNPGDGHGKTDGG